MRNHQTTIAITTAASVVPTLIATISPVPSEESWVGPWLGAWVGLLELHSFSNSDGTHGSTSAVSELIFA